MPLPDDAVNRNFFSGPDDHEIPVGDFFDRDVRFPAVANDAGGLGPKTHETFNRLRSVSFGNRFQKFSQEDQGDDHGRGVEIDPQVMSGAMKDPREKSDNRAVGIGRRRSDRDQGVHIRAAVFGRGPESPVELPSRPELNRSRQDEENPILLEESGNPGKPFGHAPEHDDAGHNGAEEEFSFQTRNFPFAGSSPPGRSDFRPRIPGPRSPGPRWLSENPRDRPDPRQRSPWPFPWQNLHSPPRRREES